MFRYLLHKIALVLPTLFGITICAFAFVRLLPGDPILAMAGEHGVTPERYEVLKEQFGYNLPIWQQYLALCRRRADRRFRRVDLVQAPGAGRLQHPVSGNHRAVALRHHLRHHLRHSGRHLRRGQARLLVRPVADGHGPDRLLHADLLVGPAADHLLFGLSRLDAGVRAASACSSSSSRSPAS